jgi:hypothetical protein
MIHSSRELGSWLHARAAFLAAASAVALVLGGCGGGGGSSDDASIPTVIEANIDTLATQIGGATTAVEYYKDGTADWTLYSMADRFAAKPIATTTTNDVVNEIRVPGFIQNITVVSYDGKNYALLSIGGKGIGVVDLANPGALTPAAYLGTMTVAYTTPAFTTVDGGGNELPVPQTDYVSGPVNDLLVDTKGDADDANDELFIANGAYGIQKTKLSKLMGVGGSGGLTIDGPQKWTLFYAGENPWGGPLSLKLEDGKLYAALGFLGMGIYNPDTLEPLGKYNLYADCTKPQEDWFGYPNLKISCPGTSAVAVSGGVQPPSATDPAAGMPSYLQAQAELKDKNMDGLVNYPWASFDRYGKYYYNARTMDVKVIGGQTMAYIAYSLGGLVAVNVTNPAAPVYRGFVPAAPAHGPDEPPINVDKKGILSHFGSGMLKEAGVMDVRVVPDLDAGPDKFHAYYTDHFAGLVVASGAEDPANQWKNGSGNYTSLNDTDTRVFWPDYEFVKSYDMRPVTVGDEAIPAFLAGDRSGNYTAPVQLVTGEINGHGGALFLLPGMVGDGAGQVDVVQSSGAGGVSFVDITKLTGTVTAVTQRFAVPVNLVSTNEVGAPEDGSATQLIAIGHSEGVTVSGNHLYLADGPHGVSVWTIANGLTPIDTLHLVANTLQSEYPTTDAVLPTPHAFKVGFSSDPNNAYVMSQSLGMRRINVSAVTSGTAQVGAPALLNAAGGVYEHNTEAGNVGTVKVTGQDHAYGATFYGKYAIVADGDNGLTVYDTTVDPATGNHVVANIGDSDGTTGKPPVGRAASVKLWTDPVTSKIYAVVAAGAYGISVIDMTAFLASGNAADLGIDKLIKTFEPLKSDDDNAFGSADGKSVDVHIVGDVAYFSYDSFGLGAYHMADLIAPPTDINPLCTDPTKLSAKQGGPAECRPTLAGYFKLQFQPGYADADGGALYMTPQYFPTQYRDASGNVVTLAQPRLLFYVAYGNAGVVKLDWSNVASPTMMAIKEVVGGAVATAINNGRVYAAAGGGGLTVLK